MSEWKAVRLVMLGVEDVSSASAIEVALDKAEEVLSNADEEQVIFIVPVPELIKHWLTTGHYRLVRAKYCAMASGLGVPVGVLMNIFRSLNSAVEWAHGCNSVSDEQKKQCFLRFGERLSAELFAAALSRRCSCAIVTVIDRSDAISSHFTVSLQT